MRLFATILLLFFAQQPVTPENSVESLQQANAAYNQGNYALAISLYESLTQVGVRDGALYYDLGNAYYQSGDLGHAMLNYRRAQDIFPRDTALDDNLARIRSARIDIQSENLDFVRGIAAATVGTLTLPELGWIVWLLWCLWWLLIGFRKRISEQFRLLIWLSSAALLIGCICLGTRLVFETVRPHAVIIEKSILVMSGPGEQYLELFSLHEAAEVQLVEMQGKWDWIELPDGRQGWVPSTAVEVVQKR